MQWALFLVGDTTDEIIASFPPSIMNRPTEGMIIVAQGLLGENEEFLVYKWSLPSDTKPGTTPETPLQSFFKPATTPPTTSSPPVTPVPTTSSPPMTTPATTATPPVTTPATIVTQGTQPGTKEELKAVDGAALASVKYTKLSGLIAKSLQDFKLQFEASFPKDDMAKAIEAAHCSIVDNKVVFTGG